MKTACTAILAAAMAVGGVGLANAAAGDGSCRQGCQKGVRERIERLAKPVERAWLSGYYHYTPVSTDDPYRYYRW